MDQDHQNGYYDGPSAGLEQDTRPEPLKLEEVNRDWNYQEMPKQPVRSSQSNMALASLVMGIIGIVTSCCYGGFIFGSLGIIFALLSKTEDRFEGYAMAGLITSVIGIVLAVLLGIVFLILVAAGEYNTGGAF
ncbi:hypothetical protein [Lacrimispora sp. JR3]|uniref:hypothetical protein n=1 Tax=Lacrimispora sinapis TaxID=3111456 RepID=UPI00374952B0